MNLSGLLLKLVLFADNYNTQPKVIFSSLYCSIQTSANISNHVTTFLNSIITVTNIWVIITLEIVTLVAPCVFFGYAAIIQYCHNIKYIYCYRNERC